MHQDHHEQEALAPADTTQDRSLASPDAAADTVRLAVWRFPRVSPLILAVVVLGSALVTALDQWVKALAVRHLDPLQPTTVIPHLLDLTLRANPGVAFGKFQHLSPMVLVLINVVVLALFVLLAWPYLRTRMGIAATILVVGGAAGNLLDRVLRQSVVDYLDFHLGPHRWPVFNLADSCVVIGVGLLIFALLRVPSASRMGEGESA